MKRIITEGRPDWEETIASQGLVYDKTTHEDGTVTHYWNENAAYEFTMDEVLTLEATTEELHKMSVEAARFLATEQLDPTSPWRQLGLPQEAVEYAIFSLDRNDPDLYGRFDLVYDGKGGPAKMLEYNADTPTGLIEASICQWYWKESLFPELDQWNGLHEALIDRWEAIRHQVPGNMLHVCHTELDESGEDILTAGYLADCAAKAGWDVTAMTMFEVGVPNRYVNQETGDLITPIPPIAEDSKFLDLEDNEMSHVFKLYPWEDLAKEGFGPLLSKWQPTGWIEPAWKMFLSTKALSAALWHLYPGHENLLPTYLGHTGGMKEFVKKPLHGREGDNVSIHTANHKESRGGRYGEEGYVYQEFCPIPNFEGPNGEPNHPILGSWVVGGESYGVGIRESDGFITDYFCRFAPNIIRN